MSNLIGIALDSPGPAVPNEAQVSRGDVPERAQVACCEDKFRDKAPRLCVLLVVYRITELLDALPAIVEQLPSRDRVHGQLIDVTDFAFQHSNLICLVKGALLQLPDLYIGLRALQQHEDSQLFMSDIAI